MDNLSMFNKEELEDTHREVLNILWHEFVCARIQAFKEAFPIKSTRNKAVSKEITRLRETYPYTHTFGEKPCETLYLGELSQEDIKIIEKYIPKLFNTFKKEIKKEEVQQYILHLHHLVIELRGDYNRKNHDLLYEKARKKYMESDSQEKKVKKIKEKVKELYNLLGCNISSSPRHEELGEMLYKVYNDIELYIPKKQSHTIKTFYGLDKIKNFLNTLYLKDKKQIINNFCNELKP